MKVLGKPSYVEVFTSIPPQILKRKKTGFTVPINLWLNTRFKDISGNILERLGKRLDLLNPKYVKIIRKNRLKSNYAWNLIMFELWYETFIENGELKPIKF